MVLKEPVPGLRRVRHNANSPKRVEVIVPAGDVLDVSDELAAQLVAADPHFEPADEPETAKPTAKKTTGRRS